MKLDDWLWIKMNRKPPTLSASYIGVILMWIYVGILIGIGLLAIVAAQGEVFVSSWLMGLGILLMGLALVSGIFTIIVDKKFGYIEAIYQHHLKKWQEKAKQLGIIKDA